MEKREDTDLRNLLHYVTVQPGLCISTTSWEVFERMTKQSEVSRELLAEALLLLMKKKEYTGITVKEIAEKAGVSRLTFYRNFDSREDILRWHIAQGFQQYLNTVDRSAETGLKAVISLCFTFWGERSEEIRLFLRQDLAYLLQQPFDSCMRTLMARLGILQEIPPMQRQFIIGGMFADMIEWISAEYPVTPENAAEEILCMFSEDFLQGKI